jgi:hypothetical protein
MKPAVIVAALITLAAPAQAQYKPTPGEAKLLRDAELRQAEEERRLMKGMPRDAVVRIFGQPKTSNVSRRNDGAREEQMVYSVKLPCRGYFDEYTMYVYTRDDIVTSFSEHSRCSR